MTFLKCKQYQRTKKGKCAELTNSRPCKIDSKRKKELSKLFQNIDNKIEAVKKRDACAEAELKSTNNVKETFQKTPNDQMSNDFSEMQTISEDKLDKSVELTNSRPDKIDSKRKKEFSKLFQNIDSKIEAVKKRDACAEAELKCTYNVKETSQKTPNDQMLYDFSEIQTISKDKKDKILEINDAYIADTNDEIQCFIEGIKSQRITSFFKPRKNTENGQIPHNLSEIQKILEGHKDRMNKIRDAYRAQISDELNCRSERKCQKITYFFKPRI